MKHTLLPVAMLAAAASSFELTAPISAGRTEIEPTVAYAAAFGGYDSDAKFSELQPGEEYSGKVAEIRVKYGFLAGWDAEFALDYSSEILKTSWFELEKKGIGKPELAVKYVGPSGLGVGLAVGFPIGSEERVGTNPAWAFQFAGILAKEFQSWRMDGGVSYVLNLENSDGFREADRLNVTFRPIWKPLPLLGVGIQGLALQQFKPRQSGRSFGEDAYLLSLGPVATLSDAKGNSLELTAPVVAKARNSMAVWGIQLQGHWGI